MFLLGIISLLVGLAYYTTVYLRYKLLVWAGYRFLSGLAHHANKKRLLKETLFIVAVSWIILYPLGWVLYWYADHYMLEKVSSGVDMALWLGFIPIMLVTCMAFKVIKREFCTILGFAEKDWNWNRPELSLFHISPENMPEKTSRRAKFDDDDSSSKSSIFDINCTWTDEEYSSYQKENYDRIYK